MMATLQEYFSYPFVRYALVVGTLIALCSSLLGVMLVLKRFSFIGDSLSHVAFTFQTIAMVLSLTGNMAIVLIGTIICAIFLLANNQNTKIKGDAALAMISVGSLALGYLIINMFSSSANVSGDVCSTLFGSTSILTLKPSNVIICIILSIIVILLFIIFYNKIFALTFDESFASATGTKTKIYSIIIAIIIATITTLAMNLVGSLLISALIIFPALSSMRLFKTFKMVTISSAIISLICAVIGIIMSILLGTPVGSMIVAINVCVFIICAIVGKIIHH
jgi:zinc transport system permease protein